MASAHLVRRRLQCAQEKYLADAAGSRRRSRRSSLNCWNAVELNCFCCGAEKTHQSSQSFLQSWSSSCKDLMQLVACIDFSTVLGWFYLLMYCTYTASHKITEWFTRFNCCASMAVLCKIKVVLLEFGQSTTAICRCFHWMVRGNASRNGGTKCIALNLPHVCSQKWSFHFSKWLLVKKKNE